MAKLKVGLVIGLMIVLQPAPAQRICCFPNPVCLFWCWVQNSRCEDSAERDYRICIRNGEEAACRTTYNFEMRVCAIEYNNCWDSC